MCSGGQQASVNAIIPRELTAILKRDFKGEIVKTIKLMSLIHAPVQKGAKIGEVILTAEGKQCGQIDLVADCTVKRASFFELCWQIFGKIIGVGVH